MTTQPSRRGRGRPPHPDILTPREWQVLDLLRLGLTNERIAERLDISYATAKYHVAEIISKLGVQSREEAAAWQPAAKRRWSERALAVLRRLGPLTLAKGAIVAGAVAALGLLAVLAWVILRSDADEQAQARIDSRSATPSASPGATQAPPPTQDPFRGIPTGPSFAYTVPDGTVWLYDLERGESAPLIAQSLNHPSSSGRAPNRAKWAPNGRWIAYLANAPGTDRLGFLTVLDLVTGSTQSPANDVLNWGWVPNSNKIWFERGEFGSEIWIFDAEQGGSMRVGEQSGRSRPVWSPDGRRLALTQIAERDAMGLPTRSDVYMFDLVSNELRRLVEGKSNEVWAFDAWSPDGRYLAYWPDAQSGSAIGGNLCVLDVDGGDQICLGNFSSDERPQWAPNSSVYIFHNYVLHPDPLRADELFTRPGAVLSWSPDGSKVALVEGAPFGRGPRSLVVLDVATMHRQTYHTTNADLGHVASPGFYAYWSNDGRYLAFVSHESGTSESLSVRIADTATGELHVISEGGPHYTQLMYSEDSSALVIEDGPQNSRSLWVAAPDGSNRRFVAQGSAIGPLPGPWYPEP